MTTITKNEVKELFSANVIYELHLVTAKISFFEKKYGMDFLSFENKINNSKKENFEEWDDYIEWAAYVKSFGKLKEEKKDLDNDNFKVTG